MDPIQIMVTNAGLDVLVNAQSGSTDAIKVTSVGITASPFVMAPTLTALPGEFKRIDAVSGESVSANVIHMTAQDSSEDTYEVRGVGLYLEDGTLFAAYGQDTAIFQKLTMSFFVMALDIAFVGSVAGSIEFGDTSFLMPPASETVKGVAEIATQDEVDTGADDTRIVSPLKLKTRLAALAGTINTTIGAAVTSMTDAIATLTGRKIVGGGLASGGGDLSADRTITVTEATAAEITAGTATDKVVTPRRLGPITMLLQQNGFIRFFGFQMAWGRFSAAANATTPVLFAEKFPNACFSAVVSGVTNLGTGSQDNTPAVIGSSITAEGFSVFNADDEADLTCYIAVGF
ncbi:hypothetical protein [Sphingomonas sp. IC081]|uniref:gp53-like domain-containing protein n=1 Tax=Sphingomonas sp. IC081 TaxID=304378 RepID=UPI00115C1AA1|nr:hypothetical protein [Sphingomonas sp. IC081]QDK32563.1 hypothetical protein DM450_07155 [Sphingomonas sp. IC081]